MRVRDISIHPVVFCRSALAEAPRVNVEVYQPNGEHGQHLVLGQFEFKHYSQMNGTQCRHQGLVGCNEVISLGAL